MTRTATTPDHPGTTPPPSGAARASRVALGLLRLTFGSVALVRPDLLVRRVEGAGTESPVAVYAFRMFGVRTVVIGGQLLLPDGPVRRAAVSTAPLIHASDTATATLLTAQGKVSARTGLPLVAVSAVNTALALLASRRSQARP
jgi:hypothetical protein